MKYKTIFARSFSREEQTKLGWGAFAGCLIVAFSFCMLFTPTSLIGPLAGPNLNLSMGMNVLLSMVNDTRTTSPTENMKTRKKGTGEISLPENGPEIVLPAEDTRGTQGNDTALPKHGLPKGTGAVNTAQSREIAPPTQPGGVETRQGNVIALPKTGQEIALPKHGRKIAPPTDDDMEKTPRPEIAPPKEEEEEEEEEEEIVQPICRVREARSDYCEMSGDVRIHGKKSTIFVVATPSLSQTSITPAAHHNSSWTIKPYARKGDQMAMKDVTELSVRMTEDPPRCNFNHTIPAVVFSLRGYSGNHFHDFSDIIIPLYATSRQFDGEVQFLVTNKNAWWVNKFRAIIEKLSNHDVINIDEDDQIRCFPRAIIGLYKKHRELSIDASKSPYSMTEFKEFLRSSYSLNKTSAIKMQGAGGQGRQSQRQPRLLIISRKRTRAFTNIPEIAKMARRIGFEVMVEEATSNVSGFARIVNSCDVMMGVHGAGLTNMAFLPDNAILIQVVPLGIEGLAGYDFGQPAVDMNIRYLEYKIREAESTLRQQYPHDHPVFRDPRSIQKLGWAAFGSVYLDKQNVKLDVRRFRATLLEALALLRQ